MKIKLIIITLGIGVFGFIGMFAFAWFTKPTSPVLGPQTAQAAPANNTSISPETTETTGAAARIASLQTHAERKLTEKELETLVYDIREKITDYDQKLIDLQVREKRLQQAQDDLNRDIEEMTNLRVELASAVAALKNEQQKLLQGRLEIESTERENLVSIAATYDKMDAESAGKILMNMVKNQNVPNSSEDAVKILYFMGDRTKAKVLASMAEAEPAISAYISQRLKRMVTKE